MNTNASLSIYICYKDPMTMIQKLCDAFGFEKIVEWPDQSNGGINHAELRLGNAIIMIQTDRIGYKKPEAIDGSTGFGFVLTLESEEKINELYERAVSHGMHSLIKPGFTQWGNYRCELQDDEGFQWSFSLYKPGESAWQ